MSRQIRASQLAVILTIFPGLAGGAVRAQTVQSAQQVPPSTANTPPGQQTVVTAAAAASDPMLAPVPEAPKQVASWEEALQLIRAQSPRYLSSQEQVRRVEAAQRAALAPVLPTANATGAYVHQFNSASISLLVPPVTAPVAVTSLSPPENTLSISGTVSWSVLNPRALYGLGTASRNTEAAKLSLADDKRTIASGVVGAMLATLAANRVSELNRVGLRAALERLGLTQARFQYGQGTALDVDRAQQDVAASRAQVVSGDEALLESREALGLAIGSAQQTAASPSLDLASFERAVAQTCRLNDDLEQRPDVKAARLRVEVAERGVTDALLMTAPSLTVLTTAGYASEAVFAPNSTWLAEGLITLPIYDGGYRYAARRDAMAQAEIARQALETTRINAAIDSSRSAREVSVTQASRDLAKEQRDIAARVDERTRDAYTRGLGTSLDLVTSAQALRAAELNLAVLDFQVAQARADAVLANAECAY